MATMYVYNIPTNETVNLRQTASSSGTILVRVGYGKAVDASASTTAGWHNASYGGYSGYIMSTYLTSTDPNGGGTGTWVTRWTNTPGETVNIRSGPGTSYSIVTTYSHGTKVEVNTPNGTWSQVRLYGNATVTGYIMTSFLVESDPGGGNGGTVTINPTLYTGKINAAQTAVRSSLSTANDSNLLGRYPTNAPIGYRKTSNTGWHQTYFGFKPSTIGYTVSNLITATSITKGQLLADIANFWYSQGATRSSLGMSGQWCQWFVNYCVTQAGLVPGNSWVTDTNTVTAWNAMKGSVSSTPTVGSIFYTKKSGDTVSHTGIVVSVTSSSVFEVIEGDYNSSTNVQKRNYQASSTYTLLGFVKPSGM